MIIAWTYGAYAQEPLYVSRAWNYSVVFTVAAVVDTRGRVTIGDSRIHALTASDRRIGSLTDADSGIGTVTISDE